MSVAASQLQRLIDSVVLHLYKVCATASLPTVCTAAPILQSTLISTVQRPELWWLRGADKMQTQRHTARKKMVNPWQKSRVDHSCGWVPLSTERMMNLSLWRIFWGKINEIKNVAVQAFIISFLKMIFAPSS